MQNALNQKRVENGAPRNRLPNTRLRDTPTRDATTTPTPTRATRNAYKIMETPPQWLECDGFIYCRVNVAKALIARTRARFAAQCRNHRYSEVSQVRSAPQLRAKFSRFVNHDRACTMELRSSTIRPPSHPCRARLARRRAARSARGTASTTRSRASLHGRTQPTPDRRHVRRKCRA